MIKPINFYTAGSPSITQNEKRIIMEITRTICLYSYIYMKI